MNQEEKIAEMQEALSMATAVCREYEIKVDRYKALLYREQEKVITLENEVVQLKMELLLYKP